ncbi:MAG: formate dehydrogenase accessory sulfurtransferase FdhD [Methanofollis sp.]|uniref:formate dehydrogenase accessory sulfurtransferase FdhD n=1 Tax=Methanofollis sp. TaxID=2052835 RepID=UPI00260D69F2|nr:formate dehydrogenase accessory sulfurtransferase FdhD [Methanofollis sp.]MDD4255260.1 formate dehydrogenase accessory sulfurtransferase FdhD [Methanofollis sp.]
MDLHTHTGIQVKRGEPREIDDEVCVEHRYLLVMNGAPVARMVASDDALREFGAGFAITEGLATEVVSVEVAGDEIRIEAVPAPACEQVVESSGGTAFLREIPRVVSDLRIGIDDVYRMTAAIESDEWQRTGGLHCSVLFCDGELCAKACDVGRHNTVDKVIGHAVLAGLDRSRCVLGCTGRQPAGMVAKAARAGIPIVISRAASTSEGIATASEAGLTLVCFSRGDRFTVYTHPERIEGVGQMGRDE